MKKFMNLLIIGLVAAAVSRIGFLATLPDVFIVTALMTIVIDRWFPNANALEVATLYFVVAVVASLVSCMGWVAFSGKAWEEIRALELLALPAVFIAPILVGVFWKGNFHD